MEKQVYSGVVKTIGDGVSFGGESTLYSYIEMSDGTIIKKLFCPMGIDGKLHEALKSDQKVELHLGPWLAKINGSEVRLLMAIKMADGRIYAMDEPANLSPNKLYMLAMLVLGVLTIPLLGLGLLVLWILWPMWKQKQFADELKAYLQSLNPIFI